MLVLPGHTTLVADGASQVKVKLLVCGGDLFASCCWSNETCSDPFGCCASSCASALAMADEMMPLLVGEGLMYCELAVGVEGDRQR